jgi:hypothetical protein
MVGSDLEKQLRNIREFLAVRDQARTAGQSACTVTMQLTFMEVNLAEIPGVVRLAIQLGVDRVKGHHLWVHLPGMQGQELRRSADAAERWNAIASECRIIAHNEPLPNGNELALVNFEPINPGPDLRRRDGPCPFLSNEAWVNWEGRFDPCCAPDALRQTLGHFGRVQEKGLLPIWKGDKYRDLLSTYTDHGVCKTCLMRPAGGRPLA